MEIQKQSSITAELNYQNLQIKAVLTKNVFINKLKPSKVGMEPSIPLWRLSWVTLGNFSALEKQNASKYVQSAFPLSTV